MNAVVLRPSLGRLVVVLGAVLLCAPIAQAQDGDKPTDAERAMVDTCLKAAQTLRAERTRCIGTVSGPCLEDEKANSTAAMSGCHRREAAIWDDLLNTAFGELQKSLETAAATKLKDVQIAWIKWRDAKCEFPFALFDGGTMAQPISAACFMDTTASRAIELRELAIDVGDR